MTTDLEDLDRVTGASDLGSAVRAARTRLGVSQAELARDARVGRQWLVGLEAGDKEQAPFSMILRVLDALDLTIIVGPTPGSPLQPHPIIYASDIVARHTRST